MDRQTHVERAAGPGTPLTAVTEPTETATAAAFAHTAVLAGKPGNAAPLAEAGRLFGRLAHLLDAVEDRAQDAAEGAWNPLTATGAGLTEARRLCDDALHGIRLALREVDFADPKLAHVLLVHELPRAVDRAFGTVRCAHTGPGPHPGPAPGAPYQQGVPAQSPYGLPPYGQPPHGQPPHGQAPHGRHGQPPYGQAPQGLNGPQQPYAGGGHTPPPDGGPGGGGWDGWGGGSDGPGGPEGPVGGSPRPGRKPPRGFWAGCAAFAGLCCTCQLCCAEEYEGPWSRKKREGSCRDLCDCCDCCECCNCDCNCDCGCCDC